MKSGIKFVIVVLAALAAMGVAWLSLNPHRYPAKKSASLAFKGAKQLGGYAKAAVLRARDERPPLILVMGECVLAEGDAPMEMTTRLSIRSRHQAIPTIVTEDSGRLEKVGARVQSGTSRFSPAACLADECVIEMACETSREVASRVDLSLQVMVMYDIATRRPQPITFEWESDASASDQP